MRSGPWAAATASASSRSVASLASGWRSTEAPPSAARASPAPETESKSPDGQVDVEPEGLGPVDAGVGSHHQRVGREVRELPDRERVATGDDDDRPGAARGHPCRFPPPALPGSGSWVGGALSDGHPLSPAVPELPFVLGASYPPRLPSTRAAHPLRRRARPLPRVRPRLHRRRDRAPPRGVGGAPGSSTDRSSPRPARSGSWPWPPPRSSAAAGSTTSGTTSSSPRRSSGPGSTPPGSGGPCTTTSASPTSSRCAPTSRRRGGSRASARAS